MLIQILIKSWKQRKSRIFLSIIAIILGSSIISGFVIVKSSVNEKLAQEFRNFGSNIIVSPSSETIEIGLPGINFGSIVEQYYIEESDLWKIKMINNWSANVLGYSPFLYQIVNLEQTNRSTPVILAGTYFLHEEPLVTTTNGSVWTTGVRISAPYWNIVGEWIIDENDNESVIVGQNIADTLGLNIDDRIEILYTNPNTLDNNSYTLNIVGIVSTGGTEDNLLFVNLNLAQDISARPNKVHSVQVSALCYNCPAEWIAEEIEIQLPYVQANSVKQLVHAEEMIMMQISQLMFLITIVAIVGSSLSIMSVLTNSVMERRKEIGVMKAIGADSKQIFLLFFAEISLIGIIGGVLGFGIGNLIAFLIANQVFQTTIVFFPFVLPMTIGISVGISLIGGFLPIYRALNIDPAIVLRGD